MPCVTKEPRVSNTVMGQSSTTPQGAVEQGIPVNESVAIPLVKRVTCPHCWVEFRPEQILWVAQHEELMGDPLLKEEPLRFLPTVLIENEVTFISIIGSAGSGKSNFLATMTWELRQRLAKDFAIIFADG